MKRKTQPPDSPFIKGDLRKFPSNKGSIRKSSLEGSIKKSPLDCVVSAQSNEKGARGL